MDKKIKDDLEDYKFNNPDKIVAPYAVNQICHKSNKRLISDMETCVEQKVPIIITSLRPPDDIIDAAHSYGGIVYHDVISVRHAEKGSRNRSRWINFSVCRSWRTCRNFITICSIKGSKGMVQRNNSSIRINRRWKF